MMPDLLDHCVDTQIGEHLHEDDAKTAAERIVPGFFMVSRTANTNLNRARRVNESFIVGQAKGRTVMKFRTHEFIPCIGVGINMDEPNWPIARQCFEDGVGDGVIVASA